MSNHIFFVVNINATHTHILNTKWKNISTIFCLFVGSLSVKLWPDKPICVDLFPTLMEEEGAKKTVYVKYLKFSSGILVSRLIGSFNSISNSFIMQISFFFLWLIWKLCRPVFVTRWQFLLGCCFFPKIHFKWKFLNEMSKTMMKKQLNYNSSKKKRKISTCFQ